MTDEYDKFLDEWVPGPLLRYAVLPPNIYDPLVRQRLRDDPTDYAVPKRKENISGQRKGMSHEEKALRSWEYFVEKQSTWSFDFIQRLRNHEDLVGLPKAKVRRFIEAFRDDWVDGRRRRQDTDFMRRLKRSIQLHDAKKCLLEPNPFVTENPDSNVEPFFTVDEMAKIFSVNDRLIELYMSDYLDHLKSDTMSALSQLYVRRGVRMPAGKIDVLIEKNYLSSYSLALEPVEQFSQTGCGKGKHEEGSPCIFSAPISAIQSRVVAFAPFVCGMDLEQLEIVVAPPITRTPLRFLDVVEGIEEYDFQ